MAGHIDRPLFYDHINQFLPRYLTLILRSIDWYIHKLLANYKSFYLSPESSCLAACVKKIKDFMVSLVEREMPIRLEDDESATIFYSWQTPWHCWLSMDKATRNRYFEKFTPILRKEGTKNLKYKLSRLIHSLLTGTPKLPYTLDELIVEM